jgi:serine/threonine-protein kinase RsbW
MRLYDQIFIHFPAKVRLVATAVAAVREYAADIGFGGSDLSRICLALEEAACYAISLGYGGERDVLRVGLGRTALGLQMTVLSKGLPLDEESLPQFDPLRLHSEGDMTGMHALLVRSAVDKAVFSILKGNRRKITLFKNLPIASPAREDQPQSEQSLPIPEDAALTTTIRLAGPGDAESISRLALRAHGSLLFNADIYYPARVREMLEQGEMRSMVVETPQGEILGHGALVAESPRALVEEITYGVVDGRLRGRHCSAAIADALLADATDRGLHCVYALAVCNHVLSQRSALSAGFRECALLLAASPPSKSWNTVRKQPGAAMEPNRIANLQLIRFLRPLPAAPLFAPERHEAMIRRIHAHLGMSEASAVPHGAHERHAPLGCVDAEQGCSARIRVETDLKEGWAWIVVLEYGRDAAARVAWQLRRLCAEGVSAIFLMLPLDVPATATMPQCFEGMGFTFSGVTFSPHGREHLALQYVNGDPGCEVVQLHSPFAREMLDYVRDCGNS